MNPILTNLNQNYLFKILSYLNSYQLQEKLIPVRNIFLVISSLILFGIIILLFKTSFLRLRYFDTFENFHKFLDLRHYNVKANRKRWNLILNKANSGQDLGLKLALIESDRLLRKFLAEKFILEGKTFQEQLNNLTADKIPNIADLRKAQDFIQKLIITPQSSSPIDFKKGREILVTLKKTFQFLGVI